MTLDNLYTITSIEESTEGFSFSLNNSLITGLESQKVFDFLKEFVSAEEINKVKVISTNYVPTAAGLASSASGFAALSVAANEYFETDFDIQDLAKLTKIGSGSACRSLQGGIVAWEKSGLVYKIDALFNDFVMISVIIEKRKKSITSRDAMEQTVQTSPLYDFWVDETNKDFLKMKEAFIKGDLKLIGELTEKSYRMMHATMLSSNPPILYINEESIKVLNLVHKLRDKSLYAYATMDAGTNVKILSTIEDMDKVTDSLISEGFSNFVVSKIGKGAHLVE
jgi:diphosphomevalonate decarboxylase